MAVKLPRKSWPRFVLVAALGGSVWTAEAQDAGKGAELLSAARAAVGGEERLRAVKTMDVRGDFKRSAGQVTLEGDLQIRIQFPDKLRRDEDTSLPGGGPSLVRTEVLNGTSVWDDNSAGGGAIFIGPGGGRGGFGRDGGRNGGRDAGANGAGGGRPAPDPAQVEEAQRRTRQADLARFALAWLLTAEGQVAWAGTAESPDGKADVLEITGGSLPTTRVFLDQTSHLPLMITWQGAAPQMVFIGRRGRGAAGPPEGNGTAPAPVPPGRGGPPPQATLRMTLGEYKAVNGIKLPHLITRGANDMTIEEWTVDSYRINSSFKNDIFVK
jgi:hypothetical protein